MRNKASNPILGGTLDSALDGSYRAIGETAAFAVGFSAASTAAYFQGENGLSYLSTLFEYASVAGLVTNIVRKLEINQPQIKTFFVVGCAASAALLTNIAGREICTKIIPVVYEMVAPAPSAKERDFSFNVPKQALMARL
jgi:hypothetical protein